ncbi:MAG: hypothetical protein ACJAQT_004323 [Akkermansiaceae bacterium]|jgi:hypothetical protein
MNLQFLIATLAAASLSAKDWPQFLGPEANATSSETGLLKSFPKDGPQILWKANLEGGFGGAAISGDEIFLGDRVEKEKDMLLCLNFKTGKEKWRYESPSEGEPSYPGSRSVPTVEDDATPTRTQTTRPRPAVRRADLSATPLEGEELWSTGDDPFMGRGGSLYADRILIIQDGENGTLRLVDPSPKGFKVQAEANIFGTDPKSRKDLKFWSPLALSNGKLIMRGQGKLICVDLKK